MALEIEPREYQDVPVEELPEELPEELAEEAIEPQEVEIEEHSIPADLLKIIRSENILKDLSESDIQSIKQRVTDGYDLDMKSMETFVDKYQKIIKLASMSDEQGDKTFPFIGASRVMLPMLPKAAVEFNSRTVPDIVNRADIANVKVWGKYPPQDKCDKAERRALAINWQLTKGIDGWRSRMDRALLLLPVGGMVFKKKWWQDGRIQESLITADKMVYDHDADSFKDAPRKSFWFYVDPNEYEAYVRAEYYADIPAHKKEEDGNGHQPRIDKPIKLIESHCTLDLDHDGYCEPYIVTFCDCCDTVVKVEKRFGERDVFVNDGKVMSIGGEEFFSQTGFIPSLDKPAVYVGWGEMLYDIFVALNTMMRQMIDAGTLNNTAANSGFISSNIKTPGRTKSQRVELILGQLTKVDTGAGQSLKDMIWTPQFAGVSQSFYQMLQDLKAEVNEYTTASQSMDVTAGEAASLYLARLQQALKVPNAIASRVYGSLTDEFLRVDDLMRRYMSEDEYKNIINWEPQVPDEIIDKYEQALQAWQQSGGEMSGVERPQDPQQVANSMVRKDDDFAEEFDIITTADPALGSEQERIARAEVIATRAAEVPGYNRYECERNFLQKIGETQVDKLLPKPSGEPDPNVVLQQQWTAADIERMKADSAKKISEIEMKAQDLEQKNIKLQAELDEIMSRTMKNLSDVDRNEAQTAFSVLDQARADLQLEVGAQEQLTARQGYKVMDHPVHGEVTEADIQQTMADNGMSRDEVIAQLQQQAQDVPPAV